MSNPPFLLIALSMEALVEIFTPITILELDRKKLFHPMLIRWKPVVHGHGLIRVKAMEEKQNTSLPWTSAE